MTSEVWQFLGFLALTGVAIVLWLFIVYLPGRTMEDWSGGEGQGGSRNCSTEAGAGEQPVSFEDRDGGR
jgi:hypothetical protein